MKPDSKLLTRSLLVAALAAMPALSGATDGFVSRTRSQTGDAKAPAYKSRLLDLAFTAASRLPVEPHLKNRSRAQEAVVTACLEVDLPQRALDYIPRIANWRRGTALADYASYSARAGRTEGLGVFLDEANSVAMDPDATAQDWRRDRILVKVAQARALMGELEDAAALEASVAASERGKVDIVRASLIDEERFDAQLASLDDIIRAQSFDHVQNAVVACLELYERFYPDAERRTRIEATLRAEWKKIPLAFRIDTILRMADAASAHGDLDAARALAVEGEKTVDEARWVPAENVAWLARLAASWQRAGGESEARSHATRALALFEDRRSTIVDVFRAEALQACAEAYQALGKSATAHAIYARAFGEATLNPNSRPRIDDLVALCCSMARHGVEPDAGLFGQIERIVATLDAPW